MPATCQFRGRDWLLAVGFFLGALALRLPFRTHYAYHWDAAQFSVAIEQYNVALSQPHAPGYFLYVMLGRWVNVVVRDPHASLVWISVVAGSALPALVYLLGRALFDRPSGAVAGWFVLTSPLAWFHSEVALTYAVDAALVCALVGLGWRAMQRGGSWADAWWLGALLALIGGVRPQTVPVLLPLVGFVFWHSDQRRLTKLVLAGLVAAGLGLLWFVPMVRLSGGLPVYWEIVRLHGTNNAAVTLAGGGWEAVWENLFWVGVYVGNGLLLGGAVLLAALVYRARGMSPERRLAWRNRHGRALTMLAFWIVPMVLFGTCLGFTSQPGYVLAYLVPLWLLAGVAVAHLKSPPRVVVVATLVSAGNVFAFLAWPAAWDGVFPGGPRTARELREHDRLMAQTVTIIREQYDPRLTIVCHASSWFALGLRHLQLHLPEFDQYQLAADPTVVGPAGRPYWRARDGRSEFVAEIDRAGKRVALLVVPPQLSAGIFRRWLAADEARLVEGSAGHLYEVAVDRVRLPPSQ